MTDLIALSIRESKPAEKSNPDIGWLGRIRWWLGINYRSND